MPPGPIARPFGPPPGLATVCFFPSGLTRVILPAAISTRMTEPSSIATGPSGNLSPDTISRMAMCVSPSIAFQQANRPGAGLPRCGHPARVRKVGTRRRGDAESKKVHHKEHEEHEEGESRAFGAQQT